MFLYALCLLLFICQAQSSWGAYRYEAETKMYYKEHKIAKTWCEAVVACSQEGAELATPLNAVEAHVLRSMENNDIWLGLNDNIVEGKFTAVNHHGMSASSNMYTNWDSGEPNDMDGKEDCVIMVDTLYVDVKCSKKYQFFCTKRQPEDAVCETGGKAPRSSSEQTRPHFRNDYHYEAETKIHYKVYRTPRTWCEAVLTCKAEGAELAEPLTAPEVRILRSLMSVIAWTGLNDIIYEGSFKTLNGTPITGNNDIYTNWNSREPNDAHSNEDCVILFSKYGLYNDDRCTKKYQFICTKRDSEVRPTKVVC